mmetsp:Transcript_9111/g.14942  ORF Transcript_9111/g.14942 Transcript_9111/m.14942 type:complete len:630 (+) Transcript_9111:148-2037(+)|eukprot:CAMPEP_0184659730 /NCGR_PEP_ID=MMETSP0308-20130426/30823_1 /TAXON_ID=38269 /ORGANISM="Gloeochaete witrockiana, Strain SAG 46.84" /LENGTH=629 /DNA_ID=CAMNT_0027099771 /DNA_START=70 /DNA_END=1959 /DNA_ORIENTATION=+
MSLLRRAFVVATTLACLLKRVEGYDTRRSLLQTSPDASQAMLNAETVKDLRAAVVGLCFGAILALIMLLVALALGAVSCCQCCCCGCCPACCKRGYIKGPINQHYSTFSVLLWRAGIVLIAIGLTIGGGLGLVGNAQVSGGSASMVTRLKNIERTITSAAGYIESAPYNTQEEAQILDKLKGAAQGLKDTFGNFGTSLGNSTIYQGVSNVRVTLYGVLFAFLLVLALIAIISSLFKLSFLLLMVVVSGIIVQPVYWVLFAIHCPLNTVAYTACNGVSHINRLADRGFVPAEIIRQCGKAKSISTSVNFYTNQSSTPYTATQLADFLSNYSLPSNVTIRAVGNSSYQLQLELVTSIVQNEAAGVAVFRDEVNSILSALPGTLSRVNDIVKPKLTELKGTFDSVANDVAATSDNNRAYCTPAGGYQAPLLLIDWSLLPRNDSTTATDAYTEGSIIKRFKCANPVLDVGLELFRANYVDETWMFRVDNATAALQQAQAQNAPPAIIQSKLQKLNDSRKLLQVLYMFEARNFSIPMRYASLALDQNTGLVGCSVLGDVHAILTNSVCGDIYNGVRYAWIGFLIGAIFTFLLMIVGFPALKRFRAKQHWQSGETSPQYGEPSAAAKPVPVQLAV